MKKLFPQFAGILLLLSLLIFSNACLSAKTQQICEVAAADFHAKLNDGKFSEIYASSGQEMKDMVKEDDFVKFLDAVHRKLGNAGQTKLAGWNTNYNTSGSFAALNYETQFAEDKATESFAFKISGEQITLVGYHVNSNALILK